MNLDADLSQLGQANILADFLEALELQDVTLVMNDWGGPQFVVALGRDERISRMGGRISHSNPRPCIGRVVHSGLTESKDPARLA